MKSQFVTRQQSVRWIKQYFTQELCQQLSLLEVEAPLLTDPKQGEQDSLSGNETAVQVPIAALARNYEVVHSLAKWKRQLLADYDFPVGQGIVTNMKALRPMEDVYSPIHSVMVDQWDWEQVIAEEQRNAVTLRLAAEAIFAALKSTVNEYQQLFAGTMTVPEKLAYVTSEDLLRRFPQKSPKDREHAIAKEYGVVFIQGIGGKLSNGLVHDTRAPDYDDWQLNGDLLVWSSVLERSVELSSMGVRVDKTRLMAQLGELNRETESLQPWHQRLLNGQLPATVGGGIGQSRLCMWLMQEPHIGCVQASVWPEEVKLRYGLV
ncbi:MAG TPA: aspartate--ammonia ligase [Aliidiomarina sp.]|nr:aspartate--ammonia ligase [Aliidiomarina sp.]